MRTLIGVEYLASDYSTGERHSRRIDTLGIDVAGRPVVVEYKRYRDENVIGQGLNHVAWLEDHQAAFRELVREKLGVARLTGVDFGTPRLLCVASEFPRQDQIAAENSRRRVELLRCRRYADAYVAVEWVFGGEMIDPTLGLGGPLRRNTGEERDLDAPRLARSSAPRSGEDPDYSVCLDWVKASGGNSNSAPRAQDDGRPVGRGANGPRCDWGSHSSAWLPPAIACRSLPMSICVCAAGSGY